jgi:pyruvate/2-oxoacid:ferredoxin oxidoreductase alpha subunit
MASVNAINTKTDLTVQIFDRFYGYEQQVPADQYDAVNSYFRSVFDSIEAAGNFTVSVFRVSNQTGIPVMNLLQQFQGQSAPQINLTLAYYLNGIRSSSTLLGVNTPTQPNFYVARNIRI